MLWARGPLAEGRGEMERGRRALLDGRPEDAAALFRDAGENFGRARGRLGNPLTRLVSWLPVLGRTPDAASVAALAGEATAEAGVTIADGVGGLPGGLAAFAPQAGAIPVEPMAQLEPTIAEAREQVLEASRILDEVELGLVPGPVAGPIRDFAEQLQDADRTLGAAGDLVEALPTFLGAEGPRQYFVGAQNPAELRGTGGLIGAYAILTVDGGRLSLGGFSSVSKLPTLKPEEVEAPNADYAARYNRYGGAGFWLNANMTPDFPSAATAIERTWAATTGEILDGTIVADPQALAILLDATGPAEVPGIGVEVDEDDVVSFVTNEAYALFEDAGRRKEVLGEVAGEVLGRFLSGTAAEDPVEAGRALARAAGGGHLLLHSAQPEVQEAFEEAGVAGRLGDGPGDFLSVVVNNAGGNKLDFYAERTLRYDVQLLPDGAADGAVTVGLGNSAPSSGAPQYVIGPYAGVSAAGENVMVVDVFCASTCELGAATRDGAPVEGSVEEELGLPVVWQNVTLPSGGSTELEYRWSVGEAWTPAGEGGTYRLTYQNQPTINPTRLEVHITPPPGMRFAPTDGVRIEGRDAVWSGRPGRLLQLDLSFARPAAARLVRDVMPAPLV